MKPTVAIFLGGLVATPLPFTVAADTVGTEATVVVHDVDFRGRPPFKRRIERLPVSELSRLETAAADATIVRMVDFSGRPPFRRNIERVEVVDASRLEVLGAADPN